MLVMLGALAVLSACGKEKEISQSVESSSVTTEEVTEVIESTEAIEEVVFTEEVREEVEVIIPEEAFDLSDKEPLEAIRAVLLDKAPFFWHYSYGVSGVKGSVHKVEGVFLYDMLDKRENVIPEFAIKDMDGDGVSEIILKWQHDNGFYLLRYWNGKVICSEFSYRALGNIREDGSSWGSSSAAESTVHKLFFIGDSSLYSTIVEKDETHYYMDDLRYYMYDVQVPKEEYIKVVDMHDALPEIEWYEFNEDEICKRVSEAMENGEEMVISKERQEYLDSFSYLMELRKCNSVNGQDAYNEDAKRYYYNAIAEMEYIYKLYKNSLSGKEQEKLEAEQKIWQEAIELRLVQDLYDMHAYSVEETEVWWLFLEQGDFYLSRACRLVNRYYGCDYYE